LRVARAQVHLASVLNFFRDNDFLLETSTPKDITLDNIARLTNSTSTSTVGSSKKSKRLTDIMEESPVVLIEGDGASTPGSDGNSLNSQDERLVSTPGTPPGSSPVVDQREEKTMRSENIMPVSPPTTPTSEPVEPTTPTISIRTSSPPPTMTLPTPPAEKLSPEKLRLRKALEIRRRKLAGLSSAPKPSLPSSPPRTVLTSRAAVGQPPPSPVEEDTSSFVEAQRVAMEEQRRHISSLERSEKDLLSGWVNFQTSTSLVLPLPSCLTVVVAAEVYTG
jgi:hypothetical protein